MMPRQLPAQPVHRLRLTLLVAASVWMNAAAAQAKTASADWRNECVGQMLLGLPGETEMAATSEKTLASEIERGRLQPPSSFADGQQAGYSNLWIGGSLMVSHPVKVSTFTAMAAKLKSVRQRSIEWAARNPDTDEGVVRVFAIPPTKSPQSVAWRINASYTLLAQVADVALYWRVNAQPGDPTTASAFAAIDQAEPRQPYSVPTRAGVCVPYAFIPDSSEQQARAVRVTYRLVEHPDVTIWLDDSTASTPQPDQIASHLTPE